MRIPRWTTYPAIALLLIVAMIGLPKNKRGRGAASLSRGQVAQPIQESTATESREPLGVQNLVDYLPTKHVTDASVDYRDEVQRAIDASAGTTLKLPDFPILVGRHPGENFGLLIREGLSITGCAGSELRTHESALQLIRAENVEGLLMSSFALVGPGGDGKRLAHGLLQITGGRGVHLRDLTVREADADGIAMSKVFDCSVEGVMVTGASKSAIYLADCEDGFVRGNFVEDFGGHQLAGNQRVGVGIQLSSNRSLLCMDNVIQKGLGIGILCNAFTGGSKPFGNTIRDNHVREVANRENHNVSGGIRLTNGSEDKETRTSVGGNSIWHCGANGIYIENHGNSDISGNLISSSDRVGILVSSIQGVRVTSNVILRSGVMQEGGDEAMAIINAASDVNFVGNVTDPEQMDLGASEPKSCSTPKVDG